MRFSKASVFQRCVIGHSEQLSRAASISMSAASSRDGDGDHDGGGDAPRSSSSSSSPETFATASLSQSQLDANAALAAQIRASKLVLAPLTRVGTLPFRRLCAELAAEASSSSSSSSSENLMNGIVTVSEMAFARGLARNDLVERARLRRSEIEASEGNCFGVQLATNAVDEGVRAARLAADAGARFVDLNCGCPIHEATRRGLGSALLRSPKKLARLVSGIAEGSPIPLTVKIRLGVTDSSANFEKVVPALIEAGAAAVAIHGRSGEGRYKKAADWKAIERAAAVAAQESPSFAKLRTPIIGNGDILTFFEAQRRIGQTPGISAVMIGRGALIRPWIFAEVKSGGEEWLPTAEERATLIYRRLVLCYKDYLGDDARGEHKSRWFLPSSIDFLNRYRPLPQSVYGGSGEVNDEDDNDLSPLMSRRDDLFDPLLGETLDSLSPLERLLRCPDPESHAAIAAALWRADSDADAVRRLQGVASESLAGWEQRVRDGGLFRSSSGSSSSSRDGDDEEGLGGGEEEGDERSRGRGRGSPGRGTRTRKLAKMKKEAEAGGAAEAVA